MTSCVRCLIKAPGDEARPWFLLGEVRTVRCWRGEDELSARRGAGNVSSRPEQGKTVNTPTKCLSALNHWYTSTHINDGQLITSVWLRDAFFFLFRRLSSIPRPPLGLKWDDMGFFMSTKIGWIVAFATGTVSQSQSLYGGSQLGWFGTESCLFFSLSSFNLPAAECRCCDRKLIYLHQCCMMVIRPVPLPTACSGGR